MCSSPPAPIYWRIKEHVCVKTKLSVILTMKITWKRRNKHSTIISFGYSRLWWRISIIFILQRPPPRTTEASPNAKIQLLYHLREVSLTSAFKHSTTRRNCLHIRLSCIYEVHEISFQNLQCNLKLLNLLLYHQQWNNYICLLPFTYLFHPTPQNKYIHKLKH